MTREEAIEFIAQSVKSDVDMAKVADAIEALEQEPIKNHLGVDCVSREQALVAIRNLYPGMPRVDFNGSLRKWVDKYKPYIECEDAIEELPPVTPIRPKGHWIEHEKSISTAFKHFRECSCCKCYFDWMMPRNSYCPNCGAKMEEVEE